MRELAGILGGCGEENVRGWEKKKDMQLCRRADIDSQRQKSEKYVTTSWRGSNPGLSIEFLLNCPVGVPEAGGERIK